MHRPIRFLASVLACLTAAWQPSSALAQDEDVQFWLLANVEGDLDDNTSINVDATYRWREAAQGDEQQSLRVTVEQQVAQGARIGGGIGVFEAGGSTEVRVHQQLVLRSGALSTRTRLEQRFFDNADQTEWRLRQRVRLSEGLGAKVTGNIELEYLRLLQTRRDDPTIPRDQWRWRAFVTYDVSDTVTIGAAYMLIHTPGGEITDEINHVPQAILTYSF